MEAEVSVGDRQNVSEEGSVNEAWGFFVVIGFWGWVLCTVGFIVRGFPCRDVFSGGTARWWGSAVIVFYCIWVMGMMNA